jgi:hypothetical protein
MALVAVQQTSTSGLVAATYSAATTGPGDTVVPGVGRFIHVKNGSGGSLTVTLVTPETRDGNAVADKTIAFTTGQEGFIATPDNSTYKDPSTGLTTITWSTVTSVTFAHVQAV